MSSTREPLTDSQIDQLDAYLLSDKVHEDALDYIALHGYLCALAISPAPLTEQEWLEQVMAETPIQEDSAECHEIFNLMRQELAFLQDCLESDQDIDLPCDLTLELDEEDDCLLEYWAQGFMELIFSQEEVWFSEQEEDVAECLLPFMLAAKLDEDEELEELRSQPEFCQQLCEQIPELLQDLYLLFRVPAEKPKGGNSGKMSSGPRKH
ncbi:MAG: YecA family protein [Oceanospirillaceae bacterium]